MSLTFETAQPLAPASPNRTDVACFIGYVARRRAVPLPATVRDQLRDAGWVQGPWRRGEDALQSLENLPVTVESWEAFARLFAWEARPLNESEDTSPATCATYLGAAVRSFFAHGGKRAVILRVGNPWPYLESGARRTARRRERLMRLVPDFADRSMPQRPFDATDPRTWQGIYHVYGMRDVSLLCLPDLPDACAVDPPIPATEVPLPVLPEGFVECSTDEPALPEDRGLRRIPAPRLDSRSYAPWRLAVASTRAFLARHQREVMLLAALPIPHVDARRVTGNGWTHAEADMPGFLRRAGGLEPAGRFEAADTTAASAFVQLAYPWLRTQAGADLPEGAEPPDGLLAGLMAANALSRGTFHSVAGRFSQPLLQDVHATLPPISWGAGADSPSSQLSQRLCIFAPTPDGVTLHSDVTTAPDPAWRLGGDVRRQRTTPVATRATQYRGTSGSVLAGGRARRAQRQ
jgi:hypothetical protein